MSIKSTIIIAKSKGLKDYDRSCQELDMPGLAQQDKVLMSR